MTGKGSRLILALVIASALFIPANFYCGSVKGMYNLIQHNQSTLTLGDRHVTVEIVEVIMEDNIDPDFSGADFNVEITVNGKTWTAEGPGNHNDVYGNDFTDGGKHTWNVGNADKVTIKVKVIDRDPFPNPDDVCDINGDSIKKRTVEFTYNLVSQNWEYYTFYGGSDGTARWWDDDDDAWIELIVSDDYTPKSSLYVSPTHLSWSDAYGWSDELKLEAKYIIIENRGDVGSKMEWCLDTEKIGGYFKISPKSGKLKAGESVAVQIDPVEFYFEDHGTKTWNFELYVVSGKLYDRKEQIPVTLTVSVTKSKNNRISVNTSTNKVKNISSPYISVIRHIQKIHGTNRNTLSRIGYIHKSTRLISPVFLRTLKGKNVSHCYSHAVYRIRKMLTQTRSVKIKQFINSESAPSH